MLSESEILAFRPNLLRYARKFAPPGHDPDDLVQGALEKIWKGRESFVRDGAGAKQGQSWMLSVAHRSFVDAICKGGGEHLRRRPLPLEELLENTASYDPKPDTVIELKETLARLECSADGRTLMSFLLGTGKGSPATHKAVWRARGDLLGEPRRNR